MAIKKMHEEKNGVIEYVITKEEDLEKLPKNGIAITSKAILVNPTIGVKTYIFYDNDVDKNTDGEWIEWKAKYRGLGDNVKDYIKEYHEDLNKIVDVTNPKIGEGYDVTINGSEEGVLNFEVNGRTLQNLWGGLANLPDNNFTIRRTSNNIRIHSRHNTVFNLTDGKFYTVIFELYNVSGDTNNQITVSMDDGNTAFLPKIGNIRNGVFIGGKTLSNYETANVKRLMFYIDSNTDYGECSASIRNIVVLEGDYTNTPIETLPFVEGIQSVGDLVEDESDVNFGKYKVEVKSVGKNLLNVSDLTFGKKIDDNGNVIIGAEYQATTEIIKLRPNTKYVYSIENVSSSPNPLNGSRVFLYDSVGNFNRAFWLATGNDKFTTDYKNYFIRIAYSLKGGISDTTLDNLQTAQLEEGTVATPYEPYHEDVKTYYLDEPLRSLPNGVCDTIEKDKVVRRVGKVVLDGSEDESFEINNSSTTTTRLAFSTAIFGKPMGIAISDKFTNSSDSDERVWLGIATGKVTIRIAKAKLLSENVSGFKTWLQANPTTVYYELAEPTEEQLPTVPMINSYNDVTHIYSTNYIQPFINIFDTISIFKDANQYLNIECDRTFALPSMDDLEDDAVKEIHMYIYMKEEATLTFPSDIKWETLSEFGKGDYVEIILTYVKTNGVGQWLGSAIVYNG